MSFNSQLKYIKKNQRRGLKQIKQLPNILLRLYHAFRPNGMGVMNNDFFAFGWTDAFIRVWYNKIANDISQYGRFGYAWDDSLGLPLGPRIYNNFATYRLLKWLGTRNLMCIGYLTSLTLILLTATQAFGLIIASAILVLFAASPLFVLGYTLLGKPEIFWWGTAGLMFYLVLQGNILYASFLWSLLAFANVPVALLSFFVFGTTTLTLAIQYGLLDNLIIGCFLGVGKILFRSYQMWRSGFLGKLVTEQSGLWKRPWLHVQSEVLILWPFVIALLSSLWMVEKVSPLLALIISGCSFFFINWRIIYLNDTQSFKFVLFFSAWAYVSSCANIGGALILLFFAYQPIVNHCGIDKLIPIKKPDIDNNFFVKLTALLKANSRILIYYPGRIRESGALRSFIEWLKFFFVGKHVSIVNDMYLPIICKPLASKVQKKLQGTKNQLNKISNLFETLAIRYVIGFTWEDVNAATKGRFSLVGKIPKKIFPNYFLKTKWYEKIDGIALLEYKGEKEFVTNAAGVQRIGQKLHFYPLRKKEHQIKIPFNSKFICLQDGKQLPITSYKPYADIDCYFMKVISLSDSEISLIWT